MENLFKLEQYKKKIESSEKEFTDNEFIESFLKLQTAVGEFSAKEKSGDSQIESEELDLKISFNTPEEHNKLTIKYFLDSLVSKMGLEKEDFEKISKIEDWRTLEKFDFKFKDGENINLFDTVPENCKILFYDHPEFVQAVYVRGINEVLYIGKLNSIIAIPTLLHEIGHGWDIKRLNELGVDSLVEYGRESVYLEAVRKERAASAFALKKLRTAIKNEDTKNDINNFLKNLALGGYCESARNSITRQESMDHGMDFTDHETSESEIQERKIFDQFLGWKETEEYQKWRELDEFKNIEEWDEYAKWKEWKENQRNNLKNKE